MSTIYDVAKHCGISAATVSYVLSGKGDARRISSATQSRVRAAAQELGYERAQIAPPDRPVVAVYWPKKQLEMAFPSLIDGINAALSTEVSPVDVVIRPYEEYHLSSEEGLWRSSTCDAAVIVAAGVDDLQYLEQFPTKMPAVLLNRNLAHYSSVSIDHDEAGRLAAEHAVRKGGSDLALVLNPSPLYGLHLRGRAILASCQAMGVDLRESIFYGENQIDSGYELGWDMIRKNQLRKVIVCIYDMVALGIISALNEAGIAVGDTVQVIATSTGPARLFARSTPPMTVVDLKMAEVTERSLKMAIDLAKHRLSGPQKILLYPTMIYRQSCPLDSSTLLDTL